MNKGFTQNDFEFLLGVIKDRLEGFISGEIAKEHENKKIFISNKDIKEINILLKELNEFEKTQKPYNIKNVRDIHIKCEEKIKNILDKYDFVKTKDFFYKL